MNKLLKIVLLNVATAVALVATTIVYVSADNISNLTNRLEINQQMLVNKQAELSILQSQEKISNINLVKNIAIFKRFLKMQNPALKLDKVEKTHRGMSYFLSGPNIDVLAIANAAFHKKLKIDIKKVSFENRHQLILSLIVLGVEN